MGFYIGANQFVHASSTGEVKISTLEDFYLERFTGARRYVQTYTYLPTGRQIGQWFASTGLPEKLEPVRAWIESLHIPDRLRPVGEWFNSLGIGERLQPVREWLEARGVPEKIESLKGTLSQLWNRLF